MQQPTATHTHTAPERPQLAASQLSSWPIVCHDTSVSEHYLTLTSTDSFFLEHALPRPPPHPPEPQTQTEANLLAPGGVGNSGLPRGLTVRAAGIAKLEYFSRSTTQQPHKLSQEAPIPSSLTAQQHNRNPMPLAQGLETVDCPGPTVGAAGLAKLE